jgi:hypothetical protein
MTKRLFTAGLCALAMCGAQAADTTVSASITNLQYTLIDLDLNDGITPAITFTSTAFDVRSATWDGGSSAELDYLDTAGSTGVERPYGSSSAAGSLTTLEARGVMTPETYAASFESRSELNRLFTLTPNTGLSWTAVGTVAAENGLPGSRAHVALGGELFAGAGYQWEEKQSFFQYRQVHDSSSTHALSGYLSTSSRALNGALRAYSQAFVYQATPVPEPSSYAMLAAGLGLIGACLRRQRRA